MKSLLICLAVVLSFCALCYAGDTALGAVCTKDDDCIANAECGIPAPCDNGTCACKNTFYKDGAACKAQIANGEACTSVGAAPECVSGMCKDLKCFVKVADAADCTDHSDCTSGYCTATKCAAKVALGAACTATEGCMTGMCDTTTTNTCICAATLKADNGKCIPKIALDTVCVATAEAGKATAAECKEGRIDGSTECVTGDKCKCKYTALADGFCSLQAYDGACTADTDCETGKCTTDKCKCMDGMVWDDANKKCEKNKIAKDQVCKLGDMCAVSDQTCIQCNGQKDMKCRTNKQTGTTGGATMIAVSLTTLFTSILALVL